jgi:hypothetical protein
MFDEEDRQCLHPIYDFGPDLGVARNHQFGDALIAAILRLSALRPTNHALFHFFIAAWLL